MANLTAQGVSVHFEGLTALAQVDILVSPSRILGLIGPNGAGKTTLLNVLNGFQRPDTGTVHVADRDVTGWPPERVARLGVARTFQAVRLFGRLSVAENVQIGAASMGLSLRQARARAGEVMERLHLADQADKRADSLPYGEERRVGIARALAMAPRFLMLDEPAAGLNDREIDDLLVTVERVQQDLSCGVLVIEHNMRLIMGLCHEIQVLDRGRTIAKGTPTQIRNDETVRQAYLGSA